MFPFEQATKDQWRECLRIVTRVLLPAWEEEKHLFSEADAAANLAEDYEDDIEGGNLAEDELAELVARRDEMTEGMIEARDDLAQDADDYAAWPKLYVDWLKGRMTNEDVGEAPDSPSGEGLDLFLLPDSANADAYKAIVVLAEEGPSEFIAHYAAIAEQFRSR